MSPLLSAALSLCALELVFTAHRLPAALVQWILFLLALLPPLAGGLKRASVRARQGTPGPRDRSRGKWALAAYCIVLQGVLCFAGFYFSDDALRHLHEGDAILRGIDVYAVPPRDWPAWLDAVPINSEHSHLGSVYFPFTQLLSAGGAFVLPARGYILLFHLVTALLSAALVFGSRNKGLSQLLLNPAFVILCSGRHEDIIGGLVFLLCAARLRAGARNGRLREFFSAAVWGCGAGLLLFVKPDGWILGGLLFWLRPRRTFAGMTAAVCFFFWFSVSFLWHDEATVRGFLSNLHLFAAWYTGYNPFSVYGPAAWPVVRLLGAGIGAAAFVWLWLKGGRRRLAAVTAALLVCVLVRGVWHPWYFFWLSSFLLYLRRPAGIELLSALCLFYIPVADLRAGSGFHFEKFYVALGIWFLARAMDKFLTARKFRRL